MPGTALVPKSRTKTVQEETTEVLPVPQDTAEDLKAETDQLLDEIDRLLDPATIDRARNALAELDDVKPYTLADAIREGSQFAPQAVGAWTTPKGEVCALSAAMLAVRARGLA